MTDDVMKNDVHKKIRFLSLKRHALALIDIVLFYACGILSCFLVSGALDAMDWILMLALAVVQVLIFHLNRIYHIKLVTGSIELVLKVLVSVIPIWALFFMYSWLRYGIVSMQVRMSVVTVCLVILSVLGIRFAYRGLLQKRLMASMSGKPKALVYGAGEIGLAIARMAHKGKFDYKVTGFIDDAYDKIGEIIQGVPVLGNLERLEGILESHVADALVIAITQISSSRMQKAVDIAIRNGLKVKIVPNLFEQGGKANRVSIRDIDYADLLGRSLIQIEREPIADMIEGKVVLVTGAGGSIGSEISRQLVSFKPAKLLLLDIDESELHDLCLRLLDYQHEWSDEVLPVLCDIRDGEKVRSIMSRHKPDIVFHAAAIKHVPMSELYPEEAVRTNICGSYNILFAAKESGAEKVVVISTDKAVNPTNVMGATKRVVEMMASALSSERTEMVAVRFGNVIGSRGSMLPLFLEEIKAGVPITVTDKRIIRYFMAIPEAVGLVFRAATLAKGSEVMVLDMGEPVNIYDFAKKLIYVFGDGTTKINVTGLRPGEKLYEELLANKDTTIPTENKRIFKAKVTNTLALDGLGEMIKMLETMEADALVTLLHSLVPEWKSTPPQYGINSK